MSKNIFAGFPSLALFAAALLLLLLLLACAPALADERIVRMDVKAQVLDDATVRVWERMEVRVEGVDIKRGIIRIFPTDYTDEKGRTNRTGFTLEGALVDGRRTEAKIDRVGRNLEIRIGSPNAVLIRGMHVFELIYSTKGWVAFREDFDEFFWNVTGTEWMWPVDEASFRILLPGGAAPDRMEAFTGRYGDTGRDFAVESAGAVATTRTLAPGEGFSVAFAWPKGIVSQPKPDFKEKARNFLIDYELPLTVMFALAVFAYYFGAWRHVGRDPSAGTVIPAWTPPEGIGPGLARYLTKLKMSEEILVADIIELAVKGFLFFEENDRGDTVIVPTGKRPGDTGSGEDRLSDSLRALFTALFPGGGAAADKAVNAAKLPVSKSSGSVFYRAMQRLEMDYSYYSKEHFSRNAAYSVLGLLLFLPLLAAVFLVAGESAELTGLVASFMVLAVIIVISAAGKFNRQASIFTAVTALIAVFVPMPLVSITVRLGFLAAAVTAFGFSMIMPARTEKGVKTLAEIKGLAMYMGTAERHRLAVLNPPDETPQFFEKLLPYAYALDCAETWANSFADVIKKASYKPNWDRTSPGEMFMWSRFSGRMAGGMAHGIRSSVNSYRDAQAKQASKSNKSSFGGGSGFGGGGGVGRGGGGGGGRGW